MTSLMVQKTTHSHYFLVIKLKVIRKRGESNLLAVCISNRCLTISLKDYRAFLVTTKDSSSLSNLMDEFMSLFHVSSTFLNSQSFSGVSTHSRL